MRRTPVVTRGHEESEPITMTEVATNQILKDIIDGNLPPDGRLRIDELKAKYQTGASPIREALTRLLSQGFVTNETRKGFRVAPISKKDITEINDVRKLIELHALRISLAHGGPDWEERIVVSMARLRLAIGRRPARDNFMDAELEAIHKGYHRALVSACDSLRLVSLQETYYDLANRYRRLALSKPAARSGFLQRHEALTEAVLSRKFDLACETLANHLDLNLLGLPGIERQESRKAAR